MPVQWLTREDLLAWIEKSGENDIGRKLHEKANRWVDDEELEKARDCYEDIVALCGQLNDTENLGIALGNLGMLYHALGAWRIAIERYQRSLHSLELHDRRREEARVLEKLGDAHRKLHRWPEAFHAYQRSLRLHHEQELGDEARRLEAKIAKLLQEDYKDELGKPRPIKEVGQRLQFFYIFDPETANRSYADRLKTASPWVTAGVFYVDEKAFLLRVVEISKETAREPLSWRLAKASKDKDEFTAFGVSDIEDVPPRLKGAEMEVEVGEADYLLTVKHEPDKKGRKLLAICKDPASSETSVRFVDRYDPTERPQNLAELRRVIGVLIRRASLDEKVAFEKEGEE